MPIIRLEPKTGTTQRATGWWVRVTRNGVVHSKLFSDSTFLNSDWALKFATLYEKYLTDKLPMPFEDSGTMLTVSKRNKYDVGKIYFTEGAFRTYWINKYGVTERASFSYARYKRRALTFAILSFRNKERISTATNIIHEKIQSEFAHKFSDIFINEDLV